jgi:hypothetical protein
MRVVLSAVQDPYFSIFRENMEMEFPKGSYSQHLPEVVDSLLGLRIPIEVAIEIPLILLGVGLVLITTQYVKLYISSLDL